MFEIIDDLVHGLYAVRNPDKLTTETTASPLIRKKDTTWKP